MTENPFKCDKCNLPCKGRLHHACIKTILTSLKPDLKMALRAIIAVLAIALLSVVL